MSGAARDISPDVRAAIARTVEPSSPLVDDVVGRLAEAVAERVLERLGGTLRPAAPARWLDASAAARLLSVSRDYIYDHADELGAVRLPGALLRFDAAVIAERLGSRYSSEDSERAGSPMQPDVSPTRRRRSTGAAADLLPIKGQIAS